MNLITVQNLAINLVLYETIDRIIELQIKTCLFFAIIYIFINHSIKLNRIQSIL